MSVLETARAWLAALNPALPAVVLVFLIWAPQAAIRRWLPAVWEWPASKGPKIRELRRVWQALPSVLAGALVTALSAKLDPWQAVTGALLGALAPFQHHLLKAISWVPYTGELGSKRDEDDDKTPPDGSKPIGPVLMVVVLCLALATGCAWWKPAVRTAIEIAAELLCEDFHSKRMGVTPEQAREAYCATEEALRPWIEQALSAQQAAGAAAPAPNSSAK